MRGNLRQGLIVAGLALSVMLVPATARAAAPGNDDFANAELITSLPFSDSIDNTTASVEPGEPQCSYAQTVWYSFTPAITEVVRVDMGGTSFFDSGLAVYQSSGTGFGGLGFVPGGCTSYGGSITFAAQAGTTYYVQAGDFSGGGGDLHVRLQVVPPPPNDDFQSAKQITALPFDETLDATAATVQANEPHDPDCIGPPTATGWYAFTPSATGSLTASLDDYYSSLAVYSGASLTSLTPQGCRNFGGPLTFHVDAGTTYYFQLVPLSPIGLGTLTLHVREAQPPIANFSFNPGDPSIFDTIQFYDQSYDPAQVGFSSEVWDFGDGTTATSPGCCPTHHYSIDGTYAVKLTSKTTDGRTASISQNVVVKTHDVTIAKVLVPNTGRVGQTRTITVGLTNSRSPETVQMVLLKSVAGGGWQQVAVLTQYVPVRSANRSTSFDFSYTFAPEDAAVGKISFEAVATIQGARDAIPNDNTFISLPTTITR